MKAKTFYLIAAMVVLAWTAACGSRQPTSAQLVRVENPRLGIAVADVPKPFELETNQGSTLRFASPGSGVLWFEVGPEMTVGINLVEEVKKRKAAFEEMPDGQYFGNRELGTPIGPAYTARGAYPGTEGTVEEIWVYTLHPSSNRLLTMIYRYPSSDEAPKRAAQLMSILGEVEGLGFPAAESGETESGEETG